MVEKLEHGRCMYNNNNNNSHFNHMSESEVVYLRFVRRMMMTRYYDDGARKIKVIFSKFVGKYYIFMRHTRISSSFS